MHLQPAPQLQFSVNLNTSSSSPASLQRLAHSVRPCRCFHWPSDWRQHSQHTACLSNDTLNLLWCAGTGGCCITVVFCHPQHTLWQRPASAHSTVCENAAQHGTAWSAAADCAAQAARWCDGQAVLACCSCSFIAGGVCHTQHVISSGFTQSQPLPHLRNQGCCLMARTLMRS